jgi:hypothetical protein
MAPGEKWLTTITNTVLKLREAAAINAHQRHSKFTKHTNICQPNNITKKYKNVTRRLKAMTIIDNLA